MTRASTRLRSLWLCVSLCVFAPALVPVPVLAQVTLAESAAVLLRAATAFEEDGQWEIAEAIYRHITEQFGGTPAAAEATSRLAAQPGDRIERSSRVELQVFGTLYGLWLGVAVPAALGADQAEGYGAGLLIGGPLGLFSSRAYGRANPMSEGQARAISWGGIWGSWQGSGWAGIADARTEAGFAATIAGGLAGIVTGAVIARNPVRSGVSSGAQGGSIWGSVYGAMIAGLFDPDAGDGVVASSLIAGNVGLIAGAAVAGKYDLSRGRVRIINLGALVGGLGGLGIDLLVQPNDDEAFIAIPLVTSIAGLAIAAHATRNSDGAVSGPGDELGQALFSYRDGKLSVGTPMPMPALLPMDDVNGRPTWRPGLSVEWLRAKF